MTGRVLRFPRRPLSSDAGRLAAERVLKTPLAERPAAAAALRLEDPETVLALCAMLRQRLESAPAAVRDEAEFLYRFLETPRREIGLFDEREYFLGETALLAGTACRHLSRRVEAQVWFDRSEAGFRHTVNAPGDLSRLGYQRLAERLEERQIDIVLELLPALIESFRSLEMTEDALKCRFLEGIVLMEADQPTRVLNAASAVLPGRSNSLVVCARLTRGASEQQSRGEASDAVTRRFRRFRQRSDHSCHRNAEAHRTTTAAHVPL